MILKSNLNITNLKVPNKYFGFIFITYFPNGKIYVGQTTKRIDTVYFGTGGQRLKSAYISHGKENLRREVLKFCSDSKELSVWEKIYILKCKSLNEEIGYNVIKGDANFKFRNPMLIPGIAQAANKVDKQKKIQSTLDWYKKNGTEHLKGENNPMFGVKRLDYKPPFKGRSHSKESREKTSRTLRENNLKKKGLL